MCLIQFQYLFCPVLIVFPSFSFSLSSSTIFLLYLSLSFSSPTLQLFLSLPVDSFFVLSWKLTDCSFDRRVRLPWIFLFPLNFVIPRGLLENHMVFDDCGFRYVFVFQIRISFFPVRCVKFSFLIPYLILFYKIFTVFIRGFRFRPFSFDFFFVEFPFVIHSRNFPYNSWIISDCVLSHSLVLLIIFVHTFVVQHYYFNYTNFLTLKFCF